MATGKPTQKMAATGTAGAVSVVLVWAAGLAGVEVPPEVAAAGAVIIAWAAGWFKSERGDHAAD